MGSTKPQDRYIRINGLKFHYLEWGKASRPMMLLLHGFASHAHVWEETAAAFSRDYHVIALDQRGHGESDWSEEMAYTIEDHFSDLAALIETIDPIHLTILGHSMGGRNAMFYATCLPHRVKRLITVDSRPGNNPLSSDTLADHLSQIPLEAAGLEEVVHAVHKIYPAIDPNVILTIVRHGHKRRDNGRFVPKFDVRMQSSLELSGYAVTDLWVYLENIACPTLVIRGKDSSFLSQTDAQRMCRLIPQARLTEIPQATHMPAHENPLAFYRAVWDFLNI